MLTGEGGCVEWWKFFLFVFGTDAVKAPALLFHTFDYLHCLLQDFHQMVHIILEVQYLKLHHQSQLSIDLQMTLSFMHVYKVWEAHHC